MMNRLFRRNGSRCNSGKSPGSQPSAMGTVQNQRLLRVEPLEDRRLLAVLMVDSLADGPVNLADGNTTLRDALALVADAAWPGADEIRFADSLGLETTPGTIELTEGQLEIDSDLTIAGPGAEQLAVDAMEEGRVIHIGPDVVVTLSGLTVTGGLMDLPLDDCNGAGILAKQSELRLVECVVAGNVSDDDGGGIYVENGSLEIVDSVVEANSAWSGGGIGLLDSPLTVTRSHISENRTSYGQGGGVLVDNTVDFPVTITDSTVSGNVARRGGGGIYNSGNLLSIVGSTFSENSIDGHDSHGGAISTQGPLTIQDSTFHANTTIVDGSNQGFGGAIYCGEASADVSIQSSTFTENSSYFRGGAICRAYGSGSLTIVDTQMSGNHATKYFHAVGDGGAVYWVGSAAITQSTFVGNNASNRGGAIYSEGTLAIVDSSITENSSRVAGGLYLVDGNLTLERSELAANSARNCGALFAWNSDVQIARSTINDNQGDTIGGAIRSINASVSLVDSELTGNRTVSEALGYGHGGGIALENSALDLTGCTVAGNSASSDGGAIHGDGSEISITDSEFMMNHSSACGGAISSSGTVSVANSTFSDNDAGEFGGAIRIYDGVLVATNTSIADNRATGRGGGIDLFSGSLVLRNSTVSDNRAGGLDGDLGGLGGGIYQYRGELIATNSVISNNSAAHTGGGVFTYCETLSLANSVISGNRAFKAGGGLDIVCEHLTIASCTIVGNAGGGIDMSSGNQTITNSIVALNGPSGGAELTGRLTAESRFNLLGGDPRFVQDPGPGADGVWGTDDDVAGDLRLTATSPAVNMGSDLLLDEVDSDGDGIDREIDLDGSGVIGDYTIGGDLAGKPRVAGAGVDIGAYEANWQVVQASDESDVITVTPGAVGGDWHQVDINGTATIYDPALAAELWIDALEGNDRVVFHGTDADEAFVVRPDSVTLSQGEFVIHVANAHSITVDAGGGDDSVTMFGSDGTNRLYSRNGDALLTDSQRSFRAHAVGFEAVTVDAGEPGRSSAYVYDSPADDVLDADPDQVVLRRSAGTTEETVTTMRGFGRATVYATGGNDVATLTGSDSATNRF